MQRNTLPRHLSPADAHAIAAGFLAARRLQHGDLRMEDTGGGDGGGSGGGSQDGGSGSDGSGGSDGGGSDGSDKGFPENTSVAEMTDKQQAAYWKYQSRKHENTVKARADYDELKTQAAEAARLRQERETENEKAIREAREQAAAEERQRLAPSLVQSEFRAAAKGVLTAEQTSALLEDLDLTKYLTDKGEVDAAKVEKKVQAFAPKGQQQGGGRQDLGQGRREGGGKPSVSAGADLFESRRKPASAKA